MKPSLAFCFGCIVLLLLFTIGNVAGQDSGCISSPCQNGGSCFELSTGGFVCSCNSNFTGNTCETALSGGPVICGFNTCANGGDCLISDGGTECKCTADFTGPTCEISATTSAPPITTQTAGSLTTKTAQTTSSSISGPKGGTVPKWVIFIVTVVAVIVIALVLLLFVMVMTGKRRGKNERKILSNDNPPMTSEFTRNLPEGDSASVDNDRTAETNLAYDPHTFGAYDDPPPDYDDDRSINGFRTPASRIYDNSKLSLTRRDPCPSNDYAEFSRSEDDGFDAALY